MTKKIDGGTIEYKGKADLKQIIDEGKKAGKALDQTKKSAQSADRQLKGAARASSGASKNFSKMSQGITGGLVPAYATLAANLFALDAVFRFLKSSADFRVLKEGQLAFAAATGVAYQSLARDLQTATRGMINFRDAAQAGAIGRAAGLSAGQLRELSEAAFTVSVALGRDVTDSFNRLVRGVTKAEPELLDELGIVLRLEEATTKYAAALGLNKNQLSIYQKSQAVVNEVLDQAETKFGKINAIMEPQANSITQLGVAFEEAIDAMRPAIAAVAEFVASFGKKNIDVLILAILGFAGGIINSVIPATHELRAAQEAQAAAYEQRLERLRIKQEELRQSKIRLANTPIAQQNLMGELDRQGVMFGGQIGEDLKAGKALSGQQIGNLRSQMSRNVGVFKGMSAGQKDTMEKILKDMKKNGGKMTKTMRLTMQQAGVELDIFKEKAGLFGEGIKGTFEKMTRGVLGFLSTIGALIAIGSIIYMIGKALYNAFNRKRIEEMKQFNEKLSEQHTSLTRINTELGKMGQVMQKGLVTGAEADIFIGNAVESADLENRLNIFADLGQQASLNQKDFNEYNAELISTFRNLARISPEFKVFAEELGRTGKLSQTSRKALLDLQESIFTVKAAQDTLKETTGELVKAQNRLVQSLPKVPYQDIIELLETQQNAYKDLVKEGKPYEDHLQLVSDKLEMMAIFQQQSIDLSIKQERLNRSGALGFLAGAGSANRQLNVKKAELKLSQEIKKANDLSFNIKMADMANDSTRLRGLRQQADLQAEMVATAKTLVKVEKIRADMMAMTVNNLYKGLEKDLGNAIGLAMRGDSSGFKKIGENMAKGITDALGQMLAEQFLEDVLPSFLKPASVKDEILEAGEKHALEVKNAILEGALFHGDTLDKHNTTLKLLVERMERTQLAVFKAEKDQNKIEQQRAKDKRDDLANKTSAPAIAAYKNSPQFQADAEAYVIDNMGSTEYNNYMRTVQNRATLADRTGAGQLGMKSSLHGGNAFPTYTDFVGADEFARRRYEQQYGKSGNYSSFEDFAKTETKLIETYRAEFEQLLQGQINFLNNPQGLSGEKFLEGAAEKYTHFLDTNITKHIAEYRDADEAYRATVTTGKTLDSQIGAITGDKKAPTLDLSATSYLKNQLNQPTGLNAITPESLTAGAMEMTFFDPATGQMMMAVPNLSGRIAQQLGNYDKTNPDQNDITPIVEPEKNNRDFSKSLNQFSGVIGMMGALTGEEEKTAKIMAKVAQIQLLVAMYDRARVAFGEGGGFMNIMSTFFLGPAGRDGGIMSSPGYRSFSGGGVAKGPNSGYGAVLHGTEAVVPLPNGRSIPVDIGKGKMSTNNTNITVNISDSGVSNNVDSDGGKELANVINMAVQERLEKEMRPGGILGA